MWHLSPVRGSPPGPVLSHHSLSSLHASMYPLGGLFNEDQACCCARAWKTHSWRKNGNDWEKQETSDQCIPGGGEGCIALAEMQIANKTGIFWGQTCTILVWLHVQMELWLQHYLNIALPHGWMHGSAMTSTVPCHILMIGIWQTFK